MVVGGLMVLFVFVLWLLGCFTMRIENGREGEEERKNVR